MPPVCVCVMVSVDEDRLCTPFGALEFLYIKAQHKAATSLAHVSIIFPNPAIKIRRRTTVSFSLRLPVPDMLSPSKSFTASPVSPLRIYISARPLPPLSPLPAQKPIASRASIPPAPAPPHLRLHIGSLFFSQRLPLLRVRALRCRVGWCLLLPALPSPSPLPALAVAVKPRVVVFFGEESSREALGVLLLACSSPVIAGRRPVWRVLLRTTKPRRHDGSITRVLHPPVADPSAADRRLSPTCARLQSTPVARAAQLHSQPPRPHLQPSPCTVRQCGSRHSVEPARLPSPVAAPPSRPS